MNQEVRDLASFEDARPDNIEMLAEVRAGLLSTPKTLPCKYFYDERGSDLFQKICDLPEYYPTRAETGLLKSMAGEIAELIGPGCQMIEYGCGSSEKMRIVLEVKTGTDTEKVMTYLLRHTDLENNFQLNFNCLKPNGEPERLSLKEICRYFLDFRKEVVTRRLKYELALLIKRLHILDGFVAIFTELDKALKLIRSSKSKQEAHDKLKKAFKLDDEQVSAILEIPLYRLVSMEVEKIIAEYGHIPGGQLRVPTHAGIRSSLLAGALLSNFMALGHHIWRLWRYNDPGDY